MQFIACHGGSASDPNFKDGTRLACQQGLKILTKKNGNALEAVIAATASLENDERFNAGTGSNFRFDGKTIQMDAACMSSQGSFGSVAVIEKVQNPIRVARQVLNTPHLLIAGQGANAFARQMGHPEYDVSTEGAKQRYDLLIQGKNPMDEWSKEALNQAWNYKTPLRQVLGSDTVGAIAFDGEGFASALSSGGLTSVLLGRVGDVPMLGGGLYAGDFGAVAATGDGEYIAQSLLAYRTYMQLAKENLSAKEAVSWALGELEENVDVGIIVCNRQGYFGDARHGMAWDGMQADHENIL